MNEKDLKQHNHELAEGREVFKWPEFQALAKRLMISMEDPIIDVTIYVPSDGMARVTVENYALDEQSSR